MENMSNPNPICTVNGVSTTDGYDASPGDTVTISLADATDVTYWSLTCFSTDDQQTVDAINSNITVNQSLKTATLVVPSTARGCVIILKSVVNRGNDQFGAVQASYTTTLGIFALGASSTRLIATKQTNEGNATFGWIEDLNAILSREFTSDAEVVSLEEATLSTTGQTAGYQIDYFGAGVKYHTYLHTTTADYNVAADDVLIMAQDDCDIYLPPPTDGRFIVIISQQHAVTVYPNATIEGTEVNHTTQFYFDHTTSSSRTFISNGTDWFIPSPIILEV